MSDQRKTGFILAAGPNTLLSGQRFAVSTAMFILAAASWGFLVLMALEPLGSAGDVGTLSFSRPQPWDMTYFIATLIMWVVMMIGMMVPSVAPTVLLYLALQRQNHQENNRSYIPSALFLCGYLAAWGAFSLAATFAQWGLSAAALLSPAMEGTSTVVGGWLFIVAGIYQLTPLKSACLRQCRAPADFLVNRRRSGTFGPFLMGIEHGIYCTGCCWLLMALLFTFGVMNLLWVALLTIFVFVEKVAPAGALFGRISSALMFGTGVALLAVG